MDGAGEGLAVIEQPNAHRIALIAYVSAMLPPPLDPRKFAALLHQPQSPGRPRPANVLNRPAQPAMVPP